MSEFEDSSEFENEGDDSFDVSRALSAIRNRWHWIFLVTAICVSVSLCVVMLMPNKYLASAVVQIDPRRTPLTNLEGFVSELKADAATIESEVEIIRSRAIARRVVEALKLRDDPEFAPSGGIKGFVVSTLFGLFSNGDGADVDGGLDRSSPVDEIASGSGEPTADGVVAAFVSRVSAKRVRTTLLIEVEFWSRDAAKSARIANAIAEVYLSEQLRAKRRTTRLASTLLEDKISSFKKKVDAAERKVAQFKIDYGMFSAEGHVLSEKALARLMEQTVNARNTTAETRAKFERAQDLVRTGENVGALTDVLKSHTVRLMKEKLADAARKRAELATRYGSRHPEMRKVQAEVASAQARLASEVGEEVAALENDYRQAQFRERELLKDLEKSKSNEAVVNQQSSVLSQYEREADTSRKLLEVLLGRFKQASESEDLQLPDARIVEQADVPLAPGSPNRMKIVAIASVGGLALALLIVLTLEFATSGLGRPEEVERALELSHLSSLPLLGEPGSDAQDSLLAARAMISSPQSGFAEAIRVVRRELDVQNGGRGPRVILVAGSLPGEGASMVSSCLAHHYAMTGREVLLVDGDVRRSNLTRHLAPQRQLGLMDVLSRGLPLEQAILHDRVSGLNFMPATSGGPGVQSNPEFLASPVMAHQVALMKNQFDVVIIDAPPLLPVIDGRILADYADQILFVMGWRTTPKALAKRALKGLAVNERKIVGVVVNQVDPVMLQDEPGFSMQTLGESVPRHQYAA